MFAVIGATGNVGSALGRELAEAARNARTRHALGRGGALRAGGPTRCDTPRVRLGDPDLAQPESLRRPLRGARAVFLMVAGSGAGLDARAIVETVVASGAQRLVLLSSIGTRSRPSASSHEPLRIFENEVQRSGLAWTILQPGGFDSNTLAWAPSVRTQRAVAAPFADVALPLVDPDDIASVAAAALRDPRHAGAVYELTGPVGISPREQAQALSEAIGAPLSFTELTRGQAAEAWRAFMPAEVVETTLDALGSPNALERRISSDVERVLGRPARSFAAWATRNAGMFR